MIKNIFRSLCTFTGAFILTFAFLTPLAHSSGDGSLDVDMAEMPPTVIIKENVVLDPATVTDPPLRLTPDKSEIIDLPARGNSIILGNDRHVNLIMDSATRLVAIPRQPGSSHFTVLGENGNVIMQRHVIVASPKKDYVRVRNVCGGETDSGCAETEVYYCHDMCHSIALPDSASGAAAGGEAAGQSGAAAGGGGMSADSFDEEFIQ